MEDEILQRLGRKELEYELGREPTDSEARVRGEKKRQERKRQKQREKEKKARLGPGAGDRGLVLKPIQPIAAKVADIIAGDEEEGETGIMEEKQGSLLDFE